MRDEPPKTRLRAAAKPVLECFKLLNLDRHEYLDPEGMGWATGNSKRGRLRTLEALAILIAVADDDGENAVRGRWCGERVVLIGKRSDPQLYRWVTEGKSMHELSSAIRDELERPAAPGGDDEPPGVGSSRRARRLL